ncbi:L,D-transpeptidase [Pseudonocardia spirodelae]|uniref:L,D-transpeptidase n=1 Tax=Pseudonocardia spirodelae TaxID=3133431 RepID=A0ABU8T1K2_9PSEU
MAHTNEPTPRLTRRTRALVVAAAGLVIGLGAAGTALAAGEDEGVGGTPCSAAAKACVDLETQQAWLMKNGVVTYGPVDVATGGQGRETPTGDFAVYDKDRDHHSAEFDGAPMPWSTFFAPGGIAFHEGDRDSGSAGCVKMTNQNATVFFSKLDKGDRVEVR